MKNTPGIKEYSSEKTAKTQGKNDINYVQNSSMKIF